MRYRRNEFLASPREFHGGATMGVRTHPGFHTAAVPETTYAYAQQKVVPVGIPPGWLDPQDVADVAGITLSDYPVVVALDMQGMKRHVDYDAVHFVRPVIRDVAKSVVESSPEDPIGDLELSCWEGTEYWDSRELEVLGWLYRIGSSVVENPSCSLLSYVEEQSDPGQFMRDLADGTLPDEALAEITGQFRYTDDVPTSRVVVVEYMAPYFPLVFDYEGQDEETEQLAVQAEAAGWSILDWNDATQDSLQPEMTTVYERKPPKSARIEYHGTSYRNLILAAPELGLPTPPPPFDPTSLA